MRTILGVYALGTALAVGSPQPSTAQQSTSCRSADSTSALMMALVARHTGASVGTPEAAARDSLQLPSANSNQLSLVTTRSVCDKAKTAYQSALPPAASGFSGRVYVVSAGNRYVVLDPDYNYNNSGIWNFVVFDNKWKKLSIF